MNDRPPVRHRPALVAYCNTIDRLNDGVGWLLGPAIILIAASILYEVVARGVFNAATIWVSESVVYGSSAVYLLTGGYALRHRRHVRIDLLLSSLSPRLTRLTEWITFPFMLLYAGTLIVIGWRLGWTSFLQSEGTGTPWNPAIWPVKFCIPAAGLLLLLQAFANLFRDVGLAPPAEPNQTVADAA